MADKKAGEFERSIDRLEEIVKLLESGDIGLDESVTLFREGRGLARKCEQLLRAAQEEVEAVSRDADSPAGPARKSSDGLFGQERKDSNEVPF